jgi:hypothetical protein
MTTKIKQIETNPESLRLSVPYGTYIDIGFETITPEIAKKWLNNNADNQRDINRANVSQYAREMKQGNWYHDKGECVKFSAKGRLLDGQHRLHGVILSDIAVTMLVMRNINDDHISAMDLGKRRNLKDILKVNQIQCPVGIGETTLSTLTTGLWYLSDYIKKAHNVNKTFRMDDIANARKPTPLELFQFLERNLHYIEQLNLLANEKPSMMLKNFAPSNLLGWYSVSLIDIDVANTIFKTLRDGVPHSDHGHSCPAIVLMKYIKEQKDNKTPVRATAYPALWLWAYEHIFDKRPPRYLRLSFGNMPCQGHKGSKQLREKLESLIK